MYFDKRTILRKGEVDMFKYVMDAKVLRCATMKCKWNKIFKEIAEAASKNKFETSIVFGRCGKKVNEFTNIIGDVETKNGFQQNIQYLIADLKLPGYKVEHLIEDEDGNIGGIYDNVHRIKINWGKVT